MNNHVAHYSIIYLNYARTNRNYLRVYQITPKEKGKTITHCFYYVCECTRIVPKSKKQILPLCFYCDINGYMVPHIGTTQPKTDHSRTKLLLTNAPVSRRMKSLTKTCTGHRSRQIKRIFYAYLLAFLRLYDGLRRPNIIPLGNKSRRVQAVSETRHLNMVALSKTLYTGEHYYA